MIRKTVAALALSVAGIATVGIGTASADVAPQKVVGSYPTMKQCTMMGTFYEAFAGADGHSCTSWNNGPYVLRVW